MGWFEKKRQEEARNRTPIGQPNLPELPKFSSDNEEFNNMTAIKQDILPPKMLPSFPKQINRASSAQIVTPITREIQDFNEIPTQVVRELGSPPKTFSKEAEPIFVKLDKFRDAAENFEGIKTRVAEIEKMLKEIMELKEKEEAEIKGWEHEIQMIKLRIENIDNSLFKKI